MKQITLRQVLVALTSVCVVLAVFRRPLLAIAEGFFVDGHWEILAAPFDDLLWLLGTADWDSLPSAEAGHKNPWLAFPLFVSFLVSIAVHVVLVVVVAVVMIVLWQDGAKNGRDRKPATPEQESPSEQPHSDVHDLAAVGGLRDGAVQQPAADPDQPESD